MSNDPQERRSLCFWINQALEANRRDHTSSIVADRGDQRGPFLSARALGLVMMAMHDAFEAGRQTPEPWKPELMPQGTPPDAAGAACAAAWTVLLMLYGRQAEFLNAQLKLWRMRHGTDAQSEAFGAAVAGAYMLWRATDPGYAMTAPCPEGECYDHAPDPLTPGQTCAGMRWGEAPAFMVPHGEVWLAPPPGAVVPEGGPLTRAGFCPGAYYMEELSEVRAFGALNSVVRQRHDLETGLFWAYDGAQGIGTPPRLYMQVALAVLEQRPKAWGSRDWLAALSAVAVAMADAGIQAWRFKYSAAHMLWRPVLGVRHVQPPGEAPWVPYGKPATNGPAADIGQTPDFPAYPSGHATFGAAAMEVLRNAVREREALPFSDDDEDRIAFTLVSDELDGMAMDPVTGMARRFAPRTYDSLWHAIVDNSESRIFLGVHWRMDGISRRLPNGASVTGSPLRPGELGEYGGTALGMSIARWIARHRGFAASPAPLAVPVVEAPTV